MDNQASSYGSYEEDNIKKGPWTAEEDSLLSHYITLHGEGNWNAAARCTGLKRTGKSCRLRWINYLRPNVRRGNITLQEQLLILELHSRWGNRWSKIAQHLPGRTDNEIKNYWRTRVQKLAKNINCDVNSKQFRDALRHEWIPRLVEKICFSSDSSIESKTTSPDSAGLESQNNTVHDCEHDQGDWSDRNFIPEVSNTSSNDVKVPVSSLSDPTDYQTRNTAVTNPNDESGSWGWYNQQGVETQSMEIQSDELLIGVDSLNSLWEDESFWLFQQELI